MTDSTAATDQLAAATDALRRARDLRDLTEPLRRLAAQNDEDIRAAAQACAAAGLSERVIATLAGAAQPTVHGWLDGRAGAPLTPSSLATEVWALHTVASALHGLVVRLKGRHLGENAPTSHHARPVDAARRAAEALQAATEALGSLGAAVEYTEVTLT